ncbi:MAG: FeoB-associated Cys-rich membrane protein [Oscillospiraceae bacterium]|nr:FeoB-associated Cys-rich membrane protein [Oscillospiraceae bacterium]
MTDIILIVILAVIVAAAAAYVIRAKKKGQKCIGCPHSGSCPSAQSGCRCHSEEK